MAASQSTRVSVLQLEKLLDFLENHEDLALGHCRSNEGRQRNKRLWNEVASTLNSIGDGANKDGVGWSKHWTIYKNRLKNKIRTDRVARHQTGAGPSNVVFTPLEERARNLIGGDAGAPLRGVQVDPFRAQESAEVQEEISQEEISQEDQANMDITFESESFAFMDQNVDQIIEQHSHPFPGPSAAPVTPGPSAAPVSPAPPAPATAPTPPAAPRPIRRQRSRPRLHSLSEARADILRIEEARVAAEARHAEVLQQMSSGLHAIAAALSELAGVLRREPQET